MSINQYLSSDIPETLWWSTQQQPTMEPSPKTLLSPLNRHHQPSPSAPPHNPTFNFNIVHQEAHTEFLPCPEFYNPTNYTKDQEQEAPKEPMFEKPLTPSDVGKLNRLVIPKQHAEKYFPLGGGAGNGTDSSVEKGLLLNFEDEIGKSWRFRYSYWNSSQSYVLTKGWSRFVKEKRLDAGDVVMFERHRLDGDRFYIGWRRRAVAVPTSTQDGGGVGFVAHDQLQGAGRVTVAPGGGGGNIVGWTRVFYNAQQAYPSHPGSSNGNGNGSCIPYQPDCLHAGSNVHNNGQTTASGNPMKRSVRLFGVNLECQADDSPEQQQQQVTPGGGSPISSQGSQAQSQSQQLSPSPHLHHNYLDMNMCRDVNQMRYQYQQQYHQG